MRLSAAMSGVVLLIALGLFGSCTTAPETSYEREALELNAKGAIEEFRRTDPTLSDTFFKNAKGYAVFPTIGKGAAGLGGAYGKGVLYEGDQVVGYCDMTQGSLGFQLGGQAYSEIVFFQTEPTLQKFKYGTFEFAAQATAVAAAAGAGANADYDHGVAVFTLGEQGLMFEASIGGQSFDFVPKEWVEK